MKGDTSFVFYGNVNTRPEVTSVHTSTSQTGE